ncbi:hypothetical protein RclHR1_06870008 [Rhizophagus clarus]|uniref:HMG box domain-containing protein n=1 Tax=Rhizophagus clarus TaxID=94130 RepID=A0A2Z6SJN7_9GLOM|nr:hypothetical protein RclHR1_06870008 [Rhizophagus clarus]GES84817.1 hypothetical protein GLOIN_2v1609917 [Rhizophagus clarus]
MAQQVTLVRSRPIVSVSSPYLLNPNHFLPKKSRGCKTSNAFMIYRKVYSRMLMIKGLPSKMTEVSRWASEAWKFEREELKNEYREFAKKVREIYRERSQMLGVPRVPLAIRPGIPNISVPVREQPDNCNEEVPVQYPTVPYQTPNVIHDIYLPEIQRFEDDFDFDNITMQDLPWIPTTSPTSNYFFYDGDDWLSTANVEFFNNFRLY